VKILIPTIGTLGDVQQFIALAQGLSVAEHTVTLPSNPILRNLVESHGVLFGLTGPDIDLAKEVTVICKAARSPVVILIKCMQS
jgi:UDP:flavonoid glycosyltransferase YjiC (YdhE family)